MSQPRYPIKATIEVVLIGNSTGLDDSDDEEVIASQAADQIDYLLREPDAIAWAGTAKFISAESDQQTAEVTLPARITVTVTKGEGVTKVRIFPGQDTEDWYAEEATEEGFETEALRLAAAGFWAPLDGLPENVVWEA